MTIGVCVTLHSTQCKILKTNSSLNSILTYTFMACTGTTLACFHCTFRCTCPLASCDVPDKSEVWCETQSTDVTTWPGIIGIQIYTYVPAISLSSDMERLSCKFPVGIRTFASGLFPSVISHTLLSTYQVRKSRRVD
jgi:hypothetical protein